MATRSTFAHAIRQDHPWYSQGLPPQRDQSAYRPERWKGSVPVGCTGELYGGGAAWNACNESCSEACSRYARWETQAAPSKETTEERRMSNPRPCDTLWGLEVPCVWRESRHESTVGHVTPQCVHWALCDAHVSYFFSVFSTRL